MSKVPLKVWASQQFGIYAPKNPRTLQRWVRDRKILPLPEKRGRAYFVLETARYLDPNDPHYIEKAAALYESEKAQ